MKKAFCTILAALLPCAATAFGGPGDLGMERTLRVADDLGTGPVKAVISPEKQRRLSEGMTCGTRSLRVTRTLEGGESVWTIRDGYEECEVSGVLDLLDLSITDLDGDGLAEIWTAYRAGCRGGVDPVPMKIIMYEGVKKHAMRGETRVPDGMGRTFGGEAKFDDAFRRAPAAFREHAAQIWNAHVDEFKPKSGHAAAPVPAAVPPAKAEPPRPARPPEKAALPPKAQPPAVAAAPIAAGAPSPAALAPAPAAKKARFARFRLQAEFSQKAMMEFAANEFDMVTPRDTDLIRKYGLKPDLDGYDYEICDDSDEWAPLVGFKNECVFEAIDAEKGSPVPVRVDWKQFLARLRAHPEGIDVTFETDADGVLKRVSEYYIP